MTRNFTMPQITIHGLKMISMVSPKPTPVKNTSNGTSGHGVVIWRDGELKYIEKK